MNQVEKKQSQPEGLTAKQAKALGAKDAANASGRDSNPKLDHKQDMFGDRYNDPLGR